jgi:hypothetical protein
VDLGAIVDHGARGRTLPLLGLPVPAPLTATAKAVAGVRYALDWRGLDYHRIAPVAGRSTPSPSAGRGPGGDPGAG